MFMFVTEKYFKCLHEVFVVCLGVLTLLLQLLRLLTSLSFSHLFFGTVLIGVQKIFENCPSQIVQMEFAHWVYLPLCSETIVIKCGMVGFSIEYSDKATRQCSNSTPLSAEKTVPGGSPSL